MKKVKRYVFHIRHGKSFTWLMLKQNVFLSVFGIGVVRLFLPITCTKYNVSLIDLNDEKKELISLEKAYKIR